jgi:hypothetical protein
VGLRVQLGQVPGPPHQPFPQQVHRKVESPARQRRHARRAAAKAENTKNTEASVEAAEVEIEKETSEVVGEKATDVVEVQDETLHGQVSDIAEEVTKDENAIEGLMDEVCSDKEYRMKANVLNEGSTIPQVDGTFDGEVAYTFVSDFHKEDIAYTIKEVMTAEDVETKLVSVIRIGGLQSAEQLCTLVVKNSPGKNFIWPRMSKGQSEVIRELKAVPHFDPA